MGRKPTGSIYESAGTWYLSMTILRKRKHFPMAWAKCQAEADIRRIFVMGLFKSLKKSNHLDLADNICRRAAEDSGTSLNALTKLVAEIAQGKVTPRPAAVAAILPNTGHLTFGELADLLTSGELARRYPDPVTVIDHTDNIYRLNKHILPLKLDGRAVKDVPIEEFTRHDADRIINQSTLPQGSRRHVGQLVHRILGLAVEPLQLIAKSPLPAAWLPKQPDSPKGAFLFPQEEAALLSCREVPLARRVFFGFCIREGIRRGRAVNLRWSQLDDIPGSKGRVMCAVPGTSNKPAVQWVLSEDTAEALRRWRILCPSDSWVFPAESVPGYRRKRAGQPIGMHKFAETLRNSLKLAGVKRKGLYDSTNGFRRLVGHDLRAGFVTQLRQSQKSDEFIQRRTGHRTKSMVDKYDHAKGVFEEALLKGWFPMHETIPELAEIMLTEDSKNHIVGESSEMKKGRSP